MNRIRNEHVLIVDEEPTTREVVGEVLRDCGYRVSLAADGREAIELSSVRPPDLVLTGLSLPRLDGIALIRRLHQRDPRLPVVLITSRAPNDARQTAKLLGAVGFINKPIDLGELEARVGRILRDRLAC